MDRGTAPGRSQHGGGAPPSSCPARPVTSRRMAATRLEVQGRHAPRHHLPGRRTGCRPSRTSSTGRGVPGCPHMAFSACSTCASSHLPQRHSAPARRSPPSHRRLGGRTGPEGPSQDAPGRRSAPLHRRSCTRRSCAQPGWRLPRWQGGGRVSRHARRFRIPSGARPSSAFGRSGSSARRSCAKPRCRSRPCPQGRPRSSPTFRPGPGRCARTASHRVLS